MEHVDPYKMKMHEEVRINSDTFIMRVPSGWLYTKVGDNHEALTTTFVKNNAT